MEKNNPTLLCENFAARYLQKNIFEEVNLSLNPEETILLTGPNGCGKSTLLKAFLGLVPKVSGSLFFARQDISRLPTAKRIRLGIGYVPQFNGVFYGMTVKENLQLSIDLTKITRKPKLEMFLEKFPTMKRFIDRKAGVLSGGEQKILTIAMSILSGAQLLLIDEPLAGLDKISTGTVLNILKGLKCEKIGMLIVEHKISEIKNISNRIIKMENGKIQEELQF